MKICIFLALAASVLLPACTSMGQVARDTDGPRSNESFVMIGVSSSDYRVIAFHGSIRDGRFYQTDGPATIAGTAQGGFLVGKATPGQFLAITVVEFLRAPNEVYGKAFYACKDAKAMVFKVPSQGVYYLGDFDYAVDGKTLRISYQDRIDSAKAHLAAFYPQVRSDVRSLHTELLPVVGGLCSPTNYIPIYIR